MSHHAPKIAAAKASQTVPYRVGKWLPSDQAILNQWLKKQIDEVDSKLPPESVQIDDDNDEIDFDYPLNPVVHNFKEAIESSPEITMFFHQMFAQIPAKYKETSTHQPQVRNCHHMLLLINHILTKAPEYNDTHLVGFPINAILDWPMGTIGCIFKCQC